MKNNTSSIVFPLKVRSTKCKTVTNSTITHTPHGIVTGTKTKKAR